MEKFTNKFTAIGEMDRKQYTMLMFKRCFPQAPVIDYDQLIEMASLVDDFMDFIMEVQDYYSIMKGIPEWADTNLLTPNELKEVKQYVEEVGLKSRLIDAEISKLRHEFFQKSEALKNELNEIHDKYKDNKLCYIFTIKRKHLPLDVNLAISSYRQDAAPIKYKTKEGEEKVYTKESLAVAYITRYKQKLLEVFREGGDVREFVLNNQAKSIQGQRFSHSSFFNITDLIKG